MLYTLNLILPQITLFAKLCKLSDNNYYLKVYGKQIINIRIILKMYNQTI